jgi:hypothetical protein
VLVKQLPAMLLMAADSDACMQYDRQVHKMEKITKKFECMPAVETRQRSRQSLCCQQTADTTLRVLHA